MTWSIESNSAEAISLSQLMEAEQSRWMRQLIQTIQGAQVNPIQTSKPRFWQVTQNQTLCGLAIISQHPWHPFWARPIIWVAPNYRRQGLGTALWYHLSDSLETSQLGFQIGMDDNDNLAQAFSQSLKFSKRLQCDEVSTRYEILTKQLSKIKPPLAKGEWHSAEQLSSSAWLDFLLHHYQQDHQWSPPRDIQDVRWPPHLQSQYDKPVSGAWLVDGQIKAAILAEQDGNHLGLIWLYGETDTDLLSALSNLLQQTPNIQTIDAEIDSIGKHAEALMPLFQNQVDSTWQIWQISRTLLSNLNNEKNQ